MARPQLKRTRYPNIKRDPLDRFWTDVTIRGVRQRKMCGSLRNARDYLASLRETDRRAELFPDEAMKKIGKSFALSDLAARFNEETEFRVKPKTMLSYRNSDRHLQRFFGAQPAYTVEARQCHQFRLFRVAEGASTSSINRDLERLRMLLNLAERDRLISRSPIRDYPLLAVVPARKRYLEDDEQRRLRAWCEANDPELWDLIHFAILTGLRAREQWGLSWKQVKDGWLEVDRPKTSTRDHLPIRATVQAILGKQRGKHSEWVFANKTMTGPIDHDNLSNRRFRRAKEGANLINFRWHDLRHTFCTRLVQRGVDLYKVMALAGHSSISTTQKYAHHALDQLAESLDVLED